MRPLAAVKALYGLPENPADVPQMDYLYLLNEAAKVVALKNHLGKPIQFMSAVDFTLPFALPLALPLGGAIGYESHIYATGQIPTRLGNAQWADTDVLHDYLNALMWLSWPKTKAALNAAQYLSIQGFFAPSPSESGSQRGPLRDRLTLLDESGIVVICEPALGEMLRCKRWTELFLDHRTLIEQGGLQIFILGHGLLQRLHAPFKSITGHAWIFHRQELGDNESLLADTLMANRLSLIQNEFERSVPFPVMGMPDWHKGWLDGEQDAAFYNDATVFRAAIAAQ
jgi:hypothetical protein